MNKTTVIVGSVTYAIKLKKLLRRVGIEATIVKHDNNENNLGCTYGVSIPESDFYSAVVIMKENNINYSVLRARK